MISKGIELELFRDWLVENKQLSESYIRAAVINVGKFIEINKIDAKIVRNFIVEHSMKKRNYSMYYYIKLYLEFKISNKKEREEIMSDIDKPVVSEGLKREHKVLLPEQLLDIISKLQNRNHKLAALIQMVTGCRIGDILKLRKNNIIPDKVIKDSKEYSVVKLSLITKGGKKKVYTIYNEYICNELIRLVKLNMIDVEDYLFLIKRNKKDTTLWNLYLSNYTIYISDLKQALESIGIDKSEFSSHDFRRMFARKVYSRWRDVEVLKKLMGHSRIETSMRYLKSSGQDTEVLYGQLDGYVDDD